MQESFYCVNAISIKTGIVCSVGAVLHQMLFTIDHPVFIIKFCFWGDFN